MARDENPNRGMTAGPAMPRQRTLRGLNGNYLRAISDEVTNSLRMKPVGPSAVERTSNQSPCLPSTLTFVPMVNVVKVAEEKFGSLRNEVAYLS